MPIDHEQIARVRFQKIEKFQLCNTMEALQLIPALRLQPSEKVIGRYINYTEINDTSIFLTDTSFLIIRKHDQERLEYCDIDGVAFPVDKVNAFSLTLFMKKKSSSEIRILPIVGGGNGGDGARDSFAFYNYLKWIMK